MPCYGTVGLAWLAHAIVWPVPAARKEFPKEDWQIDNKGDSIRIGFHLHSHAILWELPFLP